MTNQNTESAQRALRAEQQRLALIREQKAKAASMQRAANAAQNNPNVRRMT